MCPSCEGALALDGDGLSCGRCARRYPSVDGVWQLVCPDGSWRAVDAVTQKVRAFYEAHPFPDYEEVDSPQRLEQEAKRGVFARLLNEQIPAEARILDVGCGTGQLANFLALTPGRSVFGVDLSVGSLRLGDRFARTHGLGNAAFCQIDLFRPAFRRHSFDVVIANGVLHHTGDPQNGFKRLVDLAKEGGVVLIGLYNAFGRVPTHLRRAIFRVSRGRLRWLDPRIRTAGLSERRRLAWLADQYDHPHESDHTIGQVLRWFEAAGVECVNSIPKSRAFEPFLRNERLFEPQPPGGRLDRFIVQAGMLLRGGPEGGFFVMIGRTPAGAARSPQQAVSAAATAGGRGRVFLEFWEFMREEKKFWLLPILAVLVVLGLLMVFSQTSAVTPFIYTLF